MKKAVLLPFASVFGLVAAQLHADVAVSATQPAPMVQLNPAPLSPIASTADVYLIPFGPIGGDSSLDWAGRAVQQNLLTDLARNKLRPLAADKPIPEVHDAQSAAKDAGARYLITGTYQVADQQVRFTGQIIDAASGNVVGGLSATGAPRDLFSLEDSLSAQAVQALSLLLGLASSKPAATVPPALQPQVIVQMIQPPAVAQVGQATSYQGSDLQHYVDANRTPSTDFTQQLQNAQDRSTFGSYDDYGYYGFSYPAYYGNYIGYGGFGGYGVGLIYGSGFGGHFGGHSYSHGGFGFHR